MPTSAPYPNITAVILAGGRGRRMQDSDKGLLLLAGKPLVKHVLERIAPQVSQLMINCNRHADEYARFGYPIYADSVDDFPGPMAGFHSALQHSDSELFLFVPCDTPLLPIDLLDRLVAVMTRDNSDVCTVSDGERLHPVILLAKRGALAGLEDNLRQGHHKVMQWFEEQRHSVADFSERPEAFINLNTSADLNRLEDLLRGD